tara:strand:- start:1379 stop:1807 length:429 start_codon:yes stop_codon:yes gene_type:complete
MKLKTLAKAAVTALAIAPNPANARDTSHSVGAQIENLLDDSSITVDYLFNERYDKFRLKHGPSISEMSGVGYTLGLENSTSPVRVEALLSSYISESEDDVDYNLRGRIRLNRDFSILFLNLGIGYSRNLKEEYFVGVGIELE